MRDSRTPARRHRIQIRLRFQPATVELRVAETEPRVHGATASAVFKPAVLETGRRVTVPPFVAAGELVLIDTRTGEDAGRVRG